jgi:hypothetical protein
MRHGSVRLAIVLAGTLMTGFAYAGSGPAAVESTVPAPTPGALPLVLSIRALSIGETPFAETGEMERVRASTGAGSSRWPSATTSVGNGVYLSVMPGCIPGVDEPYWPGGQRPGARRR